MLIDLTLSLTPEEYEKYHMRTPNLDGKGQSREGHIGTHFDVMDKEFPLSSFRVAGKLIDISHIRGREIEVADLDGHDFQGGEMAIFKTGHLAEQCYGTPGYWKKSAELADETVAFLTDRKISLIGVDAAGVQKPTKHRAVDQYCADRNIFIIENLDNLDALDGKGNVTVFTAPLKRAGLSGLPCRVIAEVED